MLAYNANSCHILSYSAVADDFIGALFFW